jgi:hypothetical protein
VPVSVNQAGDDEAAPRIDHLGVRRRRHKIVADFSDDAITDEHVAVDQVTKARVDSDHVAALDQDLFGHDDSNLR